MGLGLGLELFSGSGLMGSGFMVLWFGVEDLGIEGVTCPPLMFSGHSVIRGVLFLKKLKLSTLTSFIAFSGLCLTALMVLLFGSTIAINVTITCMIVFVGIILYPEVKSIINAVGLSELTFLMLRSVL